MMKSVQKWFIGCVLGIIVLFLFEIGRDFFQEEELEIRNSIHNLAKETFPGAAQKVHAQYGLNPYVIGPSENKSHGESARPLVILIHGLDEPGRVWINLAPALAEKGFSVYLMSYANDQPVTVSSRFFFDTLKNYPFKNNKGIVLVGHSMGGLVSREMLTAPEIGYDQAKKSGQVPDVMRLIMVGTPNHGSELARFRFFMEIRDQIQNLFEKDTHWLQGLLDGAGEAGIDLTPGSGFLTRLNSRPHPVGIEYQIIAGVVSPWSDQDVPSLIHQLDQVLPKQTQPAVIVLDKALTAMANTIGDGLVTLDSAMLEGIPLTQVRGNHLTMIRNLTTKSHRVPPAVPRILEILETRD